MDQGRLNRIKRTDDRGFTLVELIVVLVILAILAAILVPALLGYIDRAKNQQLLITGKNVLTATQAEVASIYATADNEGINEWMYNHGAERMKELNNRIYKTADMDGQGWYCMEAAPAKNTAANHASWTVYQVIYVPNTDEGASIAYFNGKEWEVRPLEGTAEETCNKIKSEAKYKNGSEINHWYWVGKN